MAIAAEPERDRGPMSDGWARIGGGARRETQEEATSTATAQGAATTEEAEITTFDGGMARGARSARESVGDAPLRVDGVEMSSPVPPPTAIAAETPLSISSKTTISSKMSPPEDRATTNGPAISAPAPQPSDSTLPERILSAGIASDSRSGIMIKGASSMAMAPRRGTVLTTGLRQSMLIGLRERETRPELALRVGGEFAEGIHEFYGVVGYTTFRQSRTRASSEFRYDASVPAREYLYSSEQSATSANEPELWGGVGYRVNVIRGERWQAGAGAWAGYGERYARGGAEIPVTYVVSRTVRLELTPSIEYVTAHGSAVTDAVTTSTTTATAQRQVVTEQTEVAETELSAGIGLGVTVILE
jgi:hypothetical protein